MKHTLIAASLLVAGALAGDARAAEPPVQSMHVRTMLITCRIDATIKFYRDILGQQIRYDTGEYDPELTPKFVDMGPKPGKMRKVIFEGSGEYPAGNVYGSRIGFLGLVDTSAPACKEQRPSGSKLIPGGVVMPTRVANLKEIVRRMKEAGLYQPAFEPKPSPSRLTTHTIVFDPNGIALELFELNVTPLP